MKIHFASFSGGSENFRSAARRIEKEAIESNFFDEVHVCDEKTDYPVLKYFLILNKNIFRNRGFGFWSWKPHLILDIFKKASIGDVICYADSGCQISSLATEKFKENIHLCKRNKSLFFHMPNILEKHYTKYKLLKYFDCENDQLLLCSPQIQATYFYLEVCFENLMLIQNWARLSISNNFSYIDDTDSYGYDNTFKEHRHDQSILSILVKRANLKTFPHEDSFMAHEYYINSPIMLYPIHSLRERQGKKMHKLAFKYSNKNFINPKNIFYKCIGDLFYFLQMTIRKIPLLRRVYN
jgi:hypothetical protein